MSRGFQLLGYFSCFGAMLLWGGDLVAQTNAPAGAPDESLAAFDAFDDEFGDAAASARGLPLSDPLRHYNRFMFRVNDKAYVWVIKPVARGYAWVVPRPVRISVKSFFTNLGFPARFVNNTLQGKFGRSWTEVERFGINTTMGLLGFFDPADAWFEIKPAPEDFGQTLGRYGVGPGWPVVLPLLGQSTLRDMVGIGVDMFLNPVRYVEPSEVSVAIGVYDRINWISLYLHIYDTVKAEGLDAYTFMRDARLQSREAEIKE